MGVWVGGGDVLNNKTLGGLYMSYLILQILENKNKNETLQILCQTQSCKIKIIKKEVILKLAGPYDIHNDNEHLSHAHQCPEHSHNTY